LLFSVELLGSEEIFKVGAQWEVCMRHDLEGIVRLHPFALSLFHFLAIK
jgi:hypothetical protein